MTTTDDRPANLLRAAALLIERATSKLDGTHHACGECRAKRFANKEHGRVLERVDGLPDRLRASAKLLDEAPEPAAAPDDVRAAFAAATGADDAAAR